MNSAKRILLILPNKEFREILSFQLSTHFLGEVKECASIEEGIAVLEKEALDKLATTDLIISPYIDANDPFLNYLRAKSISIPLIFVCENEKVEKRSVPGIICLGFVSAKNLVQEVTKLCAGFLDESSLITNPDDFCPIRTSLLIRATPLSSDIYIRLSKDKFIKIFHAGMAFEAADLQKYYQIKKVEYMYLLRSQTSEFISMFKNELDDLLKKQNLDPKETLQMEELAQEAIYELIHRIGFSKEVQELAKKNVELALKNIGTSPKLLSLLDHLKSDSNYISQHSTLLAHISCCIAKEMEWGSDNTFNKLVIASYMHDISLHNPELAKINSLAELEDKKEQFTEAQMREYKLHPMNSADLVKNFQEIPADVDVIVSHHHERPSGSGFPRGLSHKYIAPLASVFIIAHDLTQEIISARENFALTKFVEKEKNVYFQGNFKKVMAALEKICS